MSNSVFVAAVLLGTFEFKSPPNKQMKKIDAHNQRRA